MDDEEVAALREVADAARELCEIHSAVVVADPGTSDRRWAEREEVGAFVVLSAALSKLDEVTRG